ncbi:ABC transporter permease [Microbulbifer marinus]|uniref:DUF2254 domain-containing protein n=1 Tax=Microbulbifer marinus TaxID=658218 RepID=A0A1H3VXY3_9GAMM|nr:ABC transporter permease [Microbulbifer marinus]SDZ79610.1 hypothetical protein SAMN05216562_0369 [Microbulbifer marinus]
MIDKAVVRWEKIKRKSITIKIKAKEMFLLWYAKGWQYIYFLKNRLFNVSSNYGGRLGLIFLAALIVASAIFVPALKGYFEPYFSESGRFNSIRALFLTLGGALIGATAIAFSLIMFAMQVNVERMPHGLFRKFSSDVKLLGAFVLTFSLAAIIAGLSLIPDGSWVAGATVATLWCSLLIMLLFVLAYRRALALISPTMQLGLVVADTKRNFKTWDRAVKRLVPIFRANSNSEKENEEIRNKYDMDRVAYFKLHPRWTESGEQAIYYCITFSRRYAEQGDHEVSRAALNGVVAINALYIKAKGKTFFSNNYIVNNPLASDSFLINTLEHLRQNVQVGVSRKDEQFIEQNLQGLLQLTRLYLSIEYGDSHAIKSHAQLVSGYLASAVESIIPHDMPDVLIEGVSLLGSAARLIVEYDRPEYIATISEKIAFIACAGAVNQNYQPVSQVAVKQLAILTFELLRSKSRQVRYAIKEVRDDVKLIAEMYLKIPDKPLISIHSSSLAPYYSGTSNDSLMSSLTDLTNAILNAEPGDELAQRVIRHLVEWAEELYQTEKELLLLAIEKRSHLTFDLIHWIVHVTKLLLAVSCADVCDDHFRDKLRRSAHWLIYVLSWIPDNEETIKYVETFRIADNIFESAVDAHKRGCEAEALEIRKLLLSWTRKVGKYETGWASLEKACCGLACLNLILNLPDDKLFTDIDTFLSKEGAPDFDTRLRAASDLHEQADKYRPGYGHGDIDMAMARVDQSRLSVLLHGVANHLCPEIDSVEST